MGLFFRLAIQILWCVQHNLSVHRQNCGRKTQMETFQIELSSHNFLFIFCYPTGGGTKPNIVGLDVVSIVTDLMWKRSILEVFTEKGTEIIRLVDQARIQKKEIRLFRSQFHTFLSPFHFFKCILTVIKKKELIPQLHGSERQVNFHIHFALL